MNMMLLAKEEESVLSGPARMQIAMGYSFDRSTSRVGAAAGAVLVVVVVLAVTVVAFVVFGSS